MTIIDLHEHAGQVPLDVWEFIGVKVPIIDIDNTLTPFHGKVFIPKVIEGLRSRGIADRFLGVGLASNDDDRRRVGFIRDALKDELETEVYGVSAADHDRKPDPDMGEDIASHFGIEPDQLGVIGDRWLTDVRFGRKLGARAISLCNKVGAGDAPYVPPLRILESGLVLLEQVLRTAEDNRRLAA